MKSVLVDQLKSLYADKKILVLGMGREGISTTKLLLEHGIGKHVAVADQKPFDALALETQALLQQHAVVGHWGETWLEEVHDYEIIFRSPGVSPFVPEVQSHLTGDQVITSQTNEFMLAFRTRIIGITGTKGKSTTSSLLYAVLQKQYPDTLLLGNIGKPAFDALDAITPNTRIVFELSSHQLVDITTSPHQAIILNLYQEHLDYYPSFEVYAQSKAPIIAHQQSGDSAFLSGDENVLRYYSNLGEGTKFVFGDETQALSANAQAWLATHPGINSRSVQALLAVTAHAGIAEDSVFESIADFQGLPHRFERVGTYSGRVCINDSLSTIPEATIAALHALKHVSGCLLVGGFDRGQSVETLAREIAQSSFHTVIGLPQTGWPLLDTVQAISDKTCLRVDDLESAVDQAFKATKPGDVILLSPAAASFNAFADYAARGDAFKQLVSKERSA
jgi:UDP-N-acetylmuramoylalanine--D-glutamate ligase